MSTLSKEVFRGRAQEPPKGFDPSKASDSDLEKYFYPPRPDPRKDPQEYAEWESFLARKPQHVETIPIERPPGGFEDSRSWAGAVLQASSDSKGPTEEERWTRVRGTWTVPDVSAPKDADGNLVDGRYEAWSWVGIDGWDNKVSLKVAVISRIDVDQGKHGTPFHRAQIIFRGEHEYSQVAVPDFFIHVHDQITAHVWGTPGTQNHFRASIWNITTEQESAAGLDPGLTERLKGNTALWVFAGRDPDQAGGQPIRFPGFETVVFHGTYAHRNDNAQTGVDIENAVVFNANNLDISAKRLNPFTLEFTNAKAKVPEDGPEDKGRK